MKNNQDATPTPKDLLHDLQALVVEAETMMAGALTEQSAEALTNLRARFNAAQERFTELYTQARQKVIAGAKCTDVAIRENPYQSLAVALGVGVVVGLVVGRRSR